MKKTKIQDQKKHYYLGIIVFLVVVIFAGLFYFTSQPNDPNVVNVKIKNIQEYTSLYKISVEYPIFSRASSSFNKGINEYITKSLEAYKKNADDNFKSWQANTPMGQNVPNAPDKPWDYIANWWQDQINNQYLSFGIQLNYFTGGANMTEEVKTFNYDFKTQKDVNLADLFPGMQNYLDFVSAYCKADLISQFKSQANGDMRLVPMDFIVEGTAPKMENFKNFTFNDSTITFYFPKYQVAPGVYGMQKVQVPRDKKIIEESYPDLYKKYF